MTLYQTKKSSVGVSSILPPQARNILIESAKTQDLTKINAAIRQVKQMFPSYFKPEI